MAMVDLEPIPEEDEALETFDHQGGDLETHGKVDIRSDMTRYDALRLRGLIEKHRHYTGSSVAAEILENWNQYLPRFVKVMPVDYRKALEQIKQSQNQAAQLAAVAGGK
jgi:glutamate synthase (NADPH/NADH) large chain